MLRGMNRPVKTLLRVGGLVVGIGAVVWALKDRVLPAPQIPEEPPPRFRSGPPPTAAPEAPAPSPDKLTDLKGVGPVTAGRLNDAGFTTFADIAGASPAAVSAAGKVPEGVAAGLIEQAAELA
jgi:large subunit ribosomal protein L21